MSVGLRRVAVCLGVLALLSIPATAGPPFLTDDPVPVPLGQWEVYGFSTATAVDGDTAGTLIGTEANYGAAPGLQLHILVPLAFDAPGGHGLRAGMGDVELGAKYRFIDASNGDWWPQVATFPAIEVPSGSTRQRFGSGHLRAYLPIWFEKDFGRWMTNFGAGYWINPGRGNRNSWFVGWLLQRQVSDRLALGAELYHQTANTTGGSASTGFNAGGQYDFNDHYHLLISAGRDLTHPNATNQLSYYVAIQWTG